MKACLVNFTLDLPFDHIRYEQLRRLGEYRKLENNVYRWTFLLKDFDEVQKLLGEIVEFNKELLLRDVLVHCEPLIRELEANMGTYKKTTTYQLSRSEEGYRVSWYRGSGEEVSILVSRHLIEHIYTNVIAKMKVGEPMASPKVAEKIVKSLLYDNWRRRERLDMKQWYNCLHEMFEGGTDNLEAKLAGKEFFHETSGDFNWKHFFGSRREYSKLFYSPMKCLVAMGIIEHTKAGYVIRQEGEFRLQETFQELELYIDTRPPDNKTRTQGIEKWDWGESPIKPMGVY